MKILNSMKNLAKLTGIAIALPFVMLVIMLSMPLLQLAEWLLVKAFKPMVDFLQKLLK